MIVVVSRKAKNKKQNILARSQWKGVITPYEQIGVTKGEMNLHH